MGRKPAVEPPMPEEQAAALRELILAAAYEQQAVARARQALVTAHGLGASWANLGVALNCSRETARGRVKAAQKHINGQTPGTE